MSKVKAFGISGVLLWFPSNDHNPPHFHAKRSGEWEYRIFFLLNGEVMFEEKWTKSKKGMTKHDKQEIETMVNGHRAALLLEWESIHP